MRNFIILIKNSINCTLGFVQGKKNRKKTSAVILMCIALYIGFCILYGTQIYGLFVSMEGLELYKIPVYNSYLICLFVLVMLSFQKMSGRTTTNDSDLLLSMPIKKTSIVMAKTVSKYAFDLVFAAAFILPTIVLYSIKIEASISFILWNVLLLFLLPLFSCGLSYILDFVISRLFNKIPYGNVLKIVLGIVFFGLFLVLYLSQSLSYGNIDYTNIESFIQKISPIYWMIELAFNSNLLSLLYILLCTILPFALGITLYAINFGKDFQNYNSRKNHIYFKNKSTFGGMVNKEISRYFSSPIFIFNTMIGPILLIVISIYILIKGMSGINVLLGVEVGKDIVLFFMIIIFSFLASTTLISCCSISLEGKNFWILKSSPINTKIVLFAKTIPNILIFSPISILSAIIICARLGASIDQWLFLIITPVLVNITLSFCGVFINTLFPKLHWENEAQVVKQSTSSIVTMFLGILIALIPIGIQYIPNITLNIVGYISIAIYLVLLVISTILLFTIGRNKFIKIAE